MAQNQPRDDLFVTTRWTVIASAGSLDEPEAKAALDELCRTYWKPVFSYLLRSGMDVHAAEDVTQQMFLDFLKRESFKTADRNRGKFRYFLMRCVENFARNYRDHERAAKRGGTSAHYPLDDVNTDEPPPWMPTDDANQYRDFNRAWAMQVLERAMDRLRGVYAARNMLRRFETLSRFLSEKASADDYRVLAVELRCAELTVKNELRMFRASFKKCVRLEVAQTVTNPDEIDEEIRFLLSVLGS